MSEVIRISPEQVRQVASQFRNAGEQSRQMVAQLSGSVKGVESEWAGMAKNQFFLEYQQWEGSMQQYVQLLEQIGEELEQIARRFEEADQAGGGVFQSPGLESGRPVPF